MALNVPQILPDQALELIKQLYALRLVARTVPMLHGSPGIGKSSVVQQAATELGIRLIDRRVAQMPPEDLIGLPYRDDIQGVSGYLPPDWLPRDGSGILFLDEFLCADSRVQNACLELMRDRRLGNYRLPDGWMVVLAGNDASHGAATFALTSAAADRCDHFWVVANAASWLQGYAMVNNIHPAVRTFLKVCPHRIDTIEERVRADNIAGCSPRGWEKVSHYLNHFPAGTLRDIAIAGVIGQEVATDFKQVLIEIEAYAPVREIMAENDPARRVTMLPRSLNGLWALAFGLQSEAIDVETTRRALAVSLDIPKIKLDEETGILPLAEIQRLAHELLMAKIPVLKISLKMIGTPEYRASTEWWRSVQQAHATHASGSQPADATGLAGYAGEAA